MEEYYILCPTRPTQEPALISHLISRDICAKRQSENFHKCPTCVLSGIWKKAHPEGVKAAVETVPPGEAAPSGASGTGDPSAS